MVEMQKFSLSNLNNFSETQRTPYQRITHFLFVPCPETAIDMLSICFQRLLQANEIYHVGCLGIEVYLVILVNKVSIYLIALFL